MTVKKAVIRILKAEAKPLHTKAKRWKKGNNIQKPIVQQVRGSFGAHEQI